MSNPINLESRLQDTSYNRAACIAALHGEHIPHALGHLLHRLCVVRGIRYHYGFAASLTGTLPEFTRALNARSIMSNIIPEGLDDTEKLHTAYGIPNSPRKTRIEPWRDDTAT
ncbi:hypothetical protein LTR22_028410 [Elasticomyces elasticus]|nr:hypothetical protein LTR22_028410 [Elasticomyces elasticus]